MISIRYSLISQTTDHNDDDDGGGDCSKAKKSHQKGMNDHRDELLVDIIHVYRGFPSPRRRRIIKKIHCAATRLLFSLQIRRLHHRIQRINRRAMAKPMMALKSHTTFKRFKRYLWLTTITATNSFDTIFFFRFFSRRFLRVSAFEFCVFFCCCCGFYANLHPNTFGIFSYFSLSLLSS